MTAEIPAKVHQRQEPSRFRQPSSATTRVLPAGTVEHLPSLVLQRHSFADNCIIEIDSKEVPIMDGSMAQFVEAIDEAGIREIVRAAQISQGFEADLRRGRAECWGELTPYPGFHLDVEIDFRTPLIGRQRLAFEMKAPRIPQRTGPRRTFGFMSDVELPLEGRSRLSARTSPTPSPSATIT